MSSRLLPTSTASDNAANSEQAEADAGAQRLALSAPIADPLWLLARQWQTGEFLATDGGSAIQTTVIWSSGRVLSAGAPITAALEPALESETLPTSMQADLACRVRLAAELLRMLREADLTAASLSALKAAWIAGYPFVVTAAPAALHAASSRLPDPGPMIELLGTTLDGSGSGVFPELHGLSASEPATQAVVQAVLRSWYAWALRSVTPSASAPAGTPQCTPPAWDVARLTYRVECAAQLAAGTVALTSRDYDGSGLDWFSFDRSALAAPTTGSSPVVSRTATARPGRVSYAGMPRPRWWELEDGDVNLDALRNSADPARAVLAMFAHSYSNDWFVCPVDLEPGWARIDSLQVRDTFGTLTSIVSLAEADRDEGAFRLWDLSRPPGPADAAAGIRLCWPTSPPFLDGPVLEEVLLARDEFANLAWLVERQSQDLHGATVDRYRRWLELRPADAQTVESAGNLSYRLGTTLADFWYPLKATGLANEQVLHLLEPPPEAVGVSDAGVRGVVLVRDPPAALAVSTISRQGRRIVRRNRLVLDPDGVRTWRARRHSPGDGEASSGLRFDIAVRDGS